MVSNGYFNMFTYCKERKKVNNVFQINMNALRVSYSIAC